MADALTSPDTGADAARGVRRAEIRAMSATGVIGSGFDEQEFLRALSDFRPEFIAADAGSVDPGPYALATNQAKYPRFACKRDLRIILRGASSLGVPVMVGSAGTSGSDAAVDWTVDIVEEIASEEHIALRLATIYAEQPPGYLRDCLVDGRIAPLEGAPPLTDETIDRSIRTVGMMGAEPFIDALQKGANVVIAGRASDACLFAAYPIMVGADPGPAWHAAKVLECGAGAVASRSSPDGLLATIGEGYFEVEPVNARMRCTPTSVAAHSLYENPSPFHLIEPSGIIDTEAASYAVVSDRRVRVSGSRFRPASSYSIRLESVACVGFQTIVLAGIRDERIIRRLDEWLSEVRERADTRVRAKGAGSSDEYSLSFRVYGRDAVLGEAEPLKHETPHEVGLVIEVTAATQEAATGIASIVSHTALHNPVPEWHGLISTLAYPYSPAHIERGQVFEFTMNHIVLPDTPLEMFRSNLRDIAA